MATQLTLWNETRWNDVRFPDTYYAHFKEHRQCLNCRMKLRHPLHALNHYKKFHMLPIHRFFVWKFGMWNEIPQTAYVKAKAKNFPTAITH
jgi:hypothetical protein